MRPSKQLPMSVLERNQNRTRTEMEQNRNRTERNQNRTRTRTEEPEQKNQNGTRTRTDMEFAVSKIRATMILKTPHNHSALYKIATLSWQQEMEHIHCSINLTCLITDHCKRHLAIISMYSSFHFYSVVGYNVRRHFYRFHKGMASLENKVVFCVPPYSRNCNPGEDKCRGGGEICR